MEYKCRSQRAMFCSVHWPAACVPLCAAGWSTGCVSVWTAAWEDSASASLSSPYWPCWASTCTSSAPRSDRVRCSTSPHPRPLLLLLRRAGGVKNVATRNSRLRLLKIKTNDSGRFDAQVCDWVPRLNRNGKIRRSTILTQSRLKECRDQSNVELLLCEFT